MPPLTSEESQLAERLLDKLQAFAASNLSATRYYEGKQRLDDLGISIPPEMLHLETVIGWPGIAVDVLEERLDWLGWIAPSQQDHGLAEVYDNNKLGAEGSLAELDALIYGVGYAVAGTGGDGEPEVLVTVESPMTTFVERDHRKRRSGEGVTVTRSDEAGQPEAITLYRPDETIHAERRSGQWVVVDRDQHRLGRTPVAAIVNRPWGARRRGRSEITRAIRSLTDHAARTLLGAEVAREFYSAPQRYVLGADEQAFVDAAGEVMTKWQAYLGRVWALTRDEEGELPKVGQFSASSPAPYFEQLRGLAQIFAGEAGIPASYLGFATDNPASADAIKAGEARLIKRAEKRQAQHGLGWLELGELVLLVRDQSIPDEYRRVALAWRDPATPTKAAQADAAVKLVGAGILPPSSRVTLDYVGLSLSDQQRLEEDLRRAAADRRALALAAGASATDPLSRSLAESRGDDAGDLKKKADALGVLVRSGVDPAQAARIVGLDDLTFTGAVPVSLRVPESQASRLET